MMITLRASCLSILFLLSAGHVSPADFSAPDCRPLLVDEIPYPGPDEFGQGLLWRVTKKGLTPSYVFGTIHVSDREVMAQLDNVRSALAESDVFVMESLPEPDDMVLLRQLMLFSDGTKLNDIVPPEIYTKTVQVLSAYHLTEEAISAMKPWAAYLTMSYPVSTGAVQDERLLQIARKSGITTRGLESLQEQGDLFNSFPLHDQVRLLTDAICHRETLVSDFEKMISLYRNGDLAGLFSYGQRYSFADNTLYESLTEKILIQRNYRMVERMRPLLETGAAFIAMGALHLPGEEGVLALLEKYDFEITRVF